jgi:hypothetical protein
MNHTISQSRMNAAYLQMWIRSDVVQFALALEAPLDGITAILGVAEEHLGAGHVEHGVGNVGCR